MRLDGKIVFVTGAGRGIGEAIALKASEEGASVFVADIDLATAERTAAAIVSAGGQSWPVALDVTNYEAVQAGIGSAIETAGHIDILINNAGWDQLEPFTISRPETWTKVIGINYLGVVHTVHSVLPHMIEREQGAIVNIASDAGRVGSTGEAVYSGAKGGVIAFTKTVAREVARKGIRVNTVCPGPTETPLVMEAMEENAKILAALERAIPIGRMGKPREVANAVAFMASPEASFITGQTLSVSGGLSMV